MTTSPGPTYTGELQPLVNIPFTEPDSPTLRSVIAQEAQAIELRRMADGQAASAAAADRLATAAATQAAAYAAMAGTTGGEEYARFERILLAVIRSPRDFGNADNDVAGLVNVARALAGYAAAEEARLAAPPVTP